MVTNGEVDNLRAENAASRAAQNEIANNPLRRRRTIPDGVEQLVKTMVQQKVWSKNKFVEGDRAAGQLAKKVLKASDQPGMFANDGTLTHEGQGWIERCTSACVRVLNDHRNDIVSAMSEEWKKYHAEHGKLPKIEDFAKVVARNLAEMDMDLFKFYWEKILPKAVGAKKFNEEKKYFGTPCSMHVDNKFIVSVATEAFALLAFENYHTRWPAKWAIFAHWEACRPIASPRTHKRRR